MTRLSKRIPVTHEKFGAGKISHVRHDGFARVVFKGRVTKDVHPEHLTLVLKPGDVLMARLGGISVVAAVMWRLQGYPERPEVAPGTEQFLSDLYKGRIQLPDATASERAHKELEMGIDGEHFGLQKKAFYGLLTIASRAGRGLIFPSDTKTEGLKRPDNRMTRKATNELLRWLKERHYDPRHFGRHIRLRTIDDLRKERTAKHRAQKDRSEMNPDTIVMGRRAGAYRYSKPEKFDMWKDTTPEWHRKERSDKGSKRRPYRSKSSKYRKP